MLHPAELMPREVALPKPKLSARHRLAEALRRRRTIRESSGRKIGAQLLSNLLYAACGVNRAHGPFGGLGITAASASNSREVEVYVLLAEGAYRFDAPRHALVPVVAADLRRYAFGPRQPQHSSSAPLQLVFVADVDRLEHSAGFDEPGLHDADVQRTYYLVDTGMIAANVYLLAAASRLACWFHHCDREKLARELGLKKSQRVLFAQTLGHPLNATELGDSGQIGLQVVVPPRSP